MRIGWRGRLSFLDIIVVSMVGVAGGFYIWQPIFTALKNEPPSSLNTSSELPTPPGSAKPEPAPSST
ncbi:hypothetical protein FHG87_016829 [Trinorchestia longiramus]|nr:hypothetical protein FHG87_016829 [Trinorchestia longiramus]